MGVAINSIVIMTLITTIPISPFTRSVPYHYLRDQLFTMTMIIPTFHVYHDPINSSLSW